MKSTIFAVVLLTLGLLWLPEHVAAFMAVAPIEMQRAMIFRLAYRTAAGRPIASSVVRL